MKLTITSGKGGTGKTLVATNLAATLAQQQMPVQLLDCDVEAPNDHLFFNTQNHKESPVILKIPRVDDEKCTLCNRCADVCEFNAISVFGSQVLVFNELCHACGGCTLACPEGAIQEVDHQTGIVTESHGTDITFISGLLNIGEAKAPPVIGAVKELIVSDAVNILDSPPGTSCPVVETLRGSDYVLLVAENSPFGLHDLKLAVKLVKQMELPCGLVINKADASYTNVADYAAEQNIPVLAEIPFERRIAELYSTGQLLVINNEQYTNLFTQLWDKIEQDYERTGSH